MTTEPPAPDQTTMPDNVTELSKLIQLPFENLRCFEAVREQFTHLGICFDNTVVLQPSNAAYLPENGRMVLMGSPRNGWIEITLTMPINYFACRLTSSLPATVTAYDNESRVLEMFEAESSQTRETDTELATPPSNQLVEIKVKSIQRLVLSALDGQLVIHDVYFGF